MAQSIVSKLTATGISVSEHVAAFLTARFLKTDFPDYCDLDTADDPYTLVASNGSLLTVVRYEGAASMIGPHEFDVLIDRLSGALSPLLRRQGHEIQLQFTRDPARAGEAVDKALASSWAAASRLRLQVDDILTERKNTLASWCSAESCFLALWTTPALLSPQEAARDASDRKAVLRNKPEVVAPGPRAQNVFAAAKSLRDRHAAFVKTVVDEFLIAGLVVEKTPVHPACCDIKMQVALDRTHNNWRPYLPGDRIPLSYRKNFFADDSDLQIPRLSYQIMSVDAEEIDRHTVKVGDFYYAPIHMDRFPQKPDIFNALFVKLIAYGGLPFRMMLHFTPEGMDSIFWKRMVSSFLAWGPMTDNKLIRESSNALRIMADNGANIAGCQISFVTWATSLEILAHRKNGLIRAIEGWGDGQVKEAADDPIAALADTMAGVRRRNALPIAAAPIDELLPFVPVRPASMWREGSVIFRSADGKLLPWQPNSSLQGEANVAAIYGPPGFGKSVLLSAIGFGTVLSATAAELPYIAFIERAPSSAGLISLLQEGLPPAQRHMAKYYRVQNTAEWAINPFDLQLGFRYPTPLERSFVINLLCLLATPPGEGQLPLANAPQLASLLVDECFRYYDENPKRYEPHIDPETDRAVMRGNLTLDGDVSWREVSDALFLAGDIHAATRAQLFAVPTLLDIPKILQFQRIRDEFGGTRIKDTGETLVDAMTRVVQSSVREYPALAGVTRFDIGDARVVSLDVEDVSSGTSAAGKHMGAVFLMLAMHATTRHFYFSREYAEKAPETFRDFHFVRAQKLGELGKGLFIDEYHRFKNVAPAIPEQVETTAREGRKAGISIYLASQTPDELKGPYLDDLANAVFILGAQSQKAVEKSASVFGLSDSATQAILHYCRGARDDGSGSTLFARFSTSKGTSAQILTLTIGPTELWAYSTTPSDRSLRDRLYLRMSATKARRALAQMFPKGSASSEIERRRLALQGNAGESTLNTVIDDLVREIEMRTRTVGD